MGRLGCSELRLRRHRSSSVRYPAVSAGPEASSTGRVIEAGVRRKNVRCAQRSRYVSEGVPAGPAQDAGSGHDSVLQVTQAKRCVPIAVDVVPEHSRLAPSGSVAQSAGERTVRRAPARVCEVVAVVAVVRKVGEESAELGELVWVQVSGTALSDADVLDSFVLDAAVSEDDERPEGAALEKPAMVEADQDVVGQGVPERPVVYDRIGTAMPGAFFGARACRCTCGEEQQRQRPAHAEPTRSQADDYRGLPMLVAALSRRRWALPSRVTADLPARCS